MVKSPPIFSLGVGGGGEYCPKCEAALNYHLVKGFLFGEFPHLGVLPHTLTFGNSNINQNDEMCVQNKSNTYNQEEIFYLETHISGM
jgi:hypothetical protein